MKLRCVNEFEKSGRLPALQQSARCPVVKQPNLAALTPKSWAENKQGCIV
jgi:hypothetical protein